MAIPAKITLPFVIDEETANKIIELFKEHAQQVTEPEIYCRDGKTYIEYEVSGPGGLPFDLKRDFKAHPIFKLEEIKLALQKSIEPPRPSRYGPRRRWPT